MVNYYVISKNEEAVGQGGETLYGVCACTLHDGVMEVQNPVHLGDIIADELYMRAH